MQTTLDTPVELAKQYHETGFLKLSGFFSPQEVAQWQQECDRLQKLPLVNPANKRTPHPIPDIPFPEKIDPVADISPLFEKLAHDERIFSVLKAIFDNQPALFKDKIIYKLPGMNGYGMHQDWAYGWQQFAPADDLLSVSFQIDGADASNGCIELFPGYHHRLISTPGEERGIFDEEIKQNLDLNLGQKMETKAGDVLIFHSLTPHQSGRNTANYSRRSLYLTYNAERAGNLRDIYYKHYIEVMAGRNVPDKYFE